MGAMANNFSGLSAAQGGMRKQPVAQTVGQVGSIAQQMPQMGTQGGQAGPAYPQPQLPAQPAPNPGAFGRPMGQGSGQLGGAFGGQGVPGWQPQRPQMGQLSGMLQRMGQAVGSVAPGRNVAPQNPGQLTPQNVFGNAGGFGGGSQGGLPNASAPQGFAYHPGMSMQPGVYY